MPEGRSVKESDTALIGKIETLLLKFQAQANAGDLAQLINLLAAERTMIGNRVLIESRASWEMVQRMYRKSFAGGSFLDYFWSWRCIFGGLFSILLTEIPKAKVYHTLCTGYAGLFAAGAALTTKKPMILTEHGLYTNERRIELGTAQWFHDIERINLSVAGDHFELREIWEKTFASYSRICYETADRIVSLFHENSEAQTEEGAKPERQMVIANGVNLKKFAGITPTQNRPLTVALIGRVVPIKGIKTFIQAAQTIVARVPDVRILIVGPTEEDQIYNAECVAMVEQMALTEAVSFTGSVNLQEFLGEVDVLALTSLSEAQPLVILEAGAAGIPSVATDVGSCRDLIYGTKDEHPPLGPGGAVAQVSDAADIAEKICALLLDEDLRKRCGEAIRKRVATIYTSEQQHAAYKELYEYFLEPRE